MAVITARFCYQEIPGKFFLVDCTHPCTLLSIQCCDPMLMLIQSTLLRPASATEVPGTRLQQSRLDPARLELCVPCYEIGYNRPLRFLTPIHQSSVYCTTTKRNETIGTFLMNRIESNLQFPYREKEQLEPRNLNPNPES